MSSTILPTPVSRDALHSSGVEAPTGTAVSWGAIFAGAAGAASLSLILLILGVGLGLSSVSPWSGQGITAETFGMSTVIWLTFTQLAASGMGGYLAGRLRTRWLRTDKEEVYFRDTAHGFLAWAVASLVTAAMLSSAIGSIISAGAQAGGALVSGLGAAAAVAAPAAATAVGASDETPTYFVDVLFRKDMSAMQNATSAPVAAAASTEPSSMASPSGALPVPGPVDVGGGARVTAEAARIFANAIASGTLPSEDAKYVGQLVAQSTGLSPADAEKRVTDTFTRLQTNLKETGVAARAATDKARKASSYAALWIFVSLLIGAFVSSLTATFGGRQRDLA